MIREGETPEEGLEDEERKVGREGRGGEINGDKTERRRRRRR